MIAFAEQISRIRKYHEARGTLKPGEKFGLCGHMDKAAKVTMERRELSLIVNTDDVDSDDEIVIPAGLDFKPFEKNAKVFLDHKYDSQFTMGGLRWMKAYPDKASPRGWAMTMCFFSGMKNPLCDDILNAARQEGIGASIGFIPKVIDAPRADDPPRFKSARAIIRSAAVFEVSLTMLPANLSCQMIHIPEVEDEDNDPMMLRLGSLVTKGILRPEAAIAMGWKERKLTMPLRRLRMAV